MNEVLMQKNSNGEFSQASSIEKLKVAYEKDPEKTILSAINSLKGEELANIIHDVMKQSIENTINGCK